MRSFIAVSVALLPFYDAKSYIDFHGDDPDSTVSLPNSCLGQPDSSSTMLKLAGSHDNAIINAACSNEWTIINLKQDNEWESYFKSLRKYHKGIWGPNKDDHVNWQEWMTVDMDQFIVSPDCTVCEDDHELNSMYGAASSYYMTPVAAGCTQLPIGRIGCDMDWETSACRVCETAQTREDGYWLSYEVYNGLNDPAETLHFENEVEMHTFAKYGLCGWTIRDAKAVHSGPDSFEHCKSVTHEDVEDDKILPRRKPSLGGDGQFCVCVKPKEFETFQVPAGAIEEKKGRMKEQEEKGEETEKLKAMLDEIDPSEMLTKLYQKDFDKGTYRITRPGKYIIMEDITFDFKAPDNYMDGIDTYNDDHMWWPTVEDGDEYPGAGDLSGSYFLGFWAGITIECPNVILELNHHKLQMSEAFFYQQQFFSLISLTSQVFLPGQGPGFFGSDPQSATNVMIRNGELGLSSHHGIQGHFNKDVLLNNIKIHDFKTHGIQFNGFDGVRMKNIDVGPNRKTDKLSPYYAHMKALLPTYRIMLDREEVARQTCVTFTGERYAEKSCVTLQELVNDVQTALDMAFEQALEINDWNQIMEDTTDDELAEDEELAHKLEIWADSGSVLMNSHHSTQTATLYGIFMNYIGSNVIGWYAGSDTTKSQNVYMENVKIHDLHHDTFENIAFSQGDVTASQRILNCLNAPFNAYHIFGDDGTVDVISECNNYAEDNAETKKCQLFREEGLEYAGNLITDIQFLSFELINKHDLSWNYCPGGAADMAALTEFALRGRPMYQGTPLLVGSHDPMIHPGKGVMGLRLNGVDNVDMQDVKIQNIHSTTGLGTLLGGVYEQVVSQQAPYMNGFSMNMVNGMSATFTTNMQLSNVHVDRIISNTGLAYGVAAWYETEMDITGKQGLTISNIHAGKELAPSNKFRRDSYPNLIPEACAFRIYDDVIYSVDIQYNQNAKGTDNVNIQCVTGHAGCQREKESWSNVGTVDLCPESGSTKSSLYTQRKASNNDKNDQWKDREDTSSVWSGKGQNNRKISKTASGQFIKRNGNEEQSAVVVKDGAEGVWKGMDRGVFQKIAPGNERGVLLMMASVALLSTMILCYFCVSASAFSVKRSEMAAECRPLIAQ